MVAALDLLEAERSEGGNALHLHGYQIVTVGARLDAQPVIDATGQQLAPDAESAQPLLCPLLVAQPRSARWAGCRPSRTCIPRNDRRPTRRDRPVAAQHRQ